MGCCDDVQDHVTVHGVVVPRPAQAVRGAIGLAKNALGIDQVAKATWTARLLVCQSCEWATRSRAPKFAPQRGLTTRSQCLKCACIVAQKAKLMGEDCPLGKWPPPQAAPKPTDGRS